MNGKKLEKEIDLDLHVHTVATDHAYSTVKELAESANSKGLEGFAIIEHGPNLPDAPHPFFFGNSKSIPRNINGVKIFKGAEVNIIDKDGSLDLDEGYLENLEFIAAGIHPYTGYESKSIEKNTQAAINAIKNPLIDMLVHPCDSRFEVKVGEIAEVAAENNVILELNNRSFVPDVEGNYRGDRDRALKLAKRAKELDIWVSVNSDTHYCSEIGKLSSGLEVAIDAGLTKDDIINFDIANLKDFLNSKDRDLHQRF